MSHLILPMTHEEVQKMFFEFQKKCSKQALGKINSNSLTIGQFGSIWNEYQVFNNSITSGAAALNNVITQGTVVYNDPNFLTAFPTSFAAFQAYLLNVQTVINTLFSTFPVEPALGG
jgi:hypothetical protein